MSFMVENLFSSAPMRNNLQKLSLSAKSVSPVCGVRAAQHLPSGAKTQAISLHDLSALRFGEGEVILDSKGCLVMKQNYERHGFSDWLVAPNFSPDIHSCNVQIDMASKTNFGLRSESIVMKTTRDISAGAELLLWFSEEVLAMLNMPFLTPKNISGHRKYSCHMCSKTFESPNPLKIHLLLSCERESKAQVWSNIARGLSHAYSSAEERFKSDLSTSRPSSVHSISSLPKIDTNARCISEPPLSAFLPYKKQPSPLRCGNELVQPLNLTTSQIHLTHNAPRHTPYSNLLELRLTKSLDQLSSNYAADVELFASNWGKMKQGHLCVYCGKIYSRKYGLKIHIRTHTGYKPLKCKYCQRPFGDPSNLNKHVRLHASGVTPYMCSLCGKVLVRRRDLERHMKSQHNHDDDCSSDDNENSKRMP